MMRPVEIRVREFTRQTRPHFETQYERDCVAIRSKDRFVKACIWFAVLSGLGAFLLWMFWPEVNS